MGFLVKVTEEKDYILYELRMWNLIFFSIIWGIIIMVVVYWLSYSGNLKAEPYGYLYYLVFPVFVISMFLLDKKFGEMFKAGWGPKRVRDNMMQEMLSVGKIKVKK
jgi:hypothetical protein